MSNYIVLTDSTTDLPDSLAKSLDLHVIPLKYNINGKEYVNHLDNRELDPTDFFDQVKAGAHPTTSQINPEEYVAYLTPILKDGKDVLILAFSSALSGTFNSARIASEMLMETFPDRKILLLDTKAASLGEGLVVYLTAKAIKKDKLSIEAAFEYAKKIAPQVAHWFTVDDISHLVRGGRVSKVAGFIATVANIKPILHVSDEGKLISRHKAIGRKRAIKALFEEMEKTAQNIKQTVFISHANALEEAEKLAEMIKEKFEVEELVINTLGPVIGAHAGYGTLALFFLANNR
jgi:DegV family protein with EDD domain